jgi:hypothetical protein
MRRWIERSEIISKKGLAQSLEPIQHAVHLSERLSSADLRTMPSCQKEPIAATLGRVAATRRRTPQPASPDPVPSIAVDTRAIRNGWQSINYIEARRGILNHVPEFPPHGLGDHHG